jgi:hypothetical protein
MPALRCIGRHAKLAMGERGEGIAVRLWQRETYGTAAKTPIFDRTNGRLLFAKAYVRQN